MADAVLLLAHGTPDRIEEIPEYLSRVTGGRPLPHEVVEEVSHRFSIIGGSPLTPLTLEQGRLLQQELGLPVYVGMRNWKPYIADVVHQMRADGITRAVVICLAPQNSRTSVGLYRRAVFAAADGRIDLNFLSDWADHPALIDGFAERLRTVLDAPASESASIPTVLFTAHSVPCRTVLSAPQTDPGAPLQPPDPYPVEAKLTARLVAAQVGLPESGWFFAFQSQGMSGGPWIGPTVEDTLTALHQQGVTSLVIQPIGFLCDHVEILYDIDVGFQEFAKKLGITLRRPASLNDSPHLTRALADLVRHGRG
ncbi:MAG TPA: ferrochelatase [Acidobacteriaceae bacterium]|nr:ferrochelatase [Acidobacteriaceae bacterium]